MRYLITISLLVLSSCAFEPTGFDGTNEDGGNSQLDMSIQNNDTTNSSTANGSTRNNTTDNNLTSNNTTELDAGNNTTGNNTTGNNSTGADAGNNSTGADAGASDMGPPTCDGQVVNLQTSNLHCGECGNSCDEDYGQCRRGVCECFDPYAACGNDNHCTNKLTDPSNCGVCGFECGTGQFCSQGSCECLPGLTLCGTECVDTNRDPRHCGMCNESCGSNACRGGSCRPNDDCGITQFECRLASGGTQCVDNPGSPLNCNANVVEECGEVCDGSELCYRSGLFEPRSCRTYRPARGCVNCPCADCSDAGENCIKLDGFPDDPFCVD